MKARRRFGQPGAGLIVAAFLPGMLVQELGGAPVAARERVRKAAATQVRLETERTYIWFRQIWHSKGDPILTTDCPFRAVDDGEDGIPFEEYLYARASMVATGPHGPRELYQRVLIFIQQYDHLRDDRSFRGERGEPSMVEYAKRWRMTERSAYRALQEFVTVFPELGEHPAAICEELWDGVAKQAGPSSLMRVLSVKVKPR